MGMLGIYNYQRLPIDAVPDITNVQVQINTIYLEVSMEILKCFMLKVMDRPI